MHGDIAATVCVMEAEIISSQKRSREGSVNSRIQVQLEDDEGDSIRLQAVCGQFQWQQRGMSQC